MLSVCCYFWVALPSLEGEKKKLIEDTKGGVEEIELSDITVLDAHVYVIEYNFL